MTYVGKKPADIIATAVDTTTGTFSGDLTVDTNTLYVDSANNRVGVGTTSPELELHIKGSGNQSLRLETTDSTYIGFDIQQNSDGSGQILLRDSKPLIFYTNSSEAMRIDSSGNAGIGTSSPSEVLEISKDDRANGATLRITNSASSSSWISGDIIGTIDFYSSDASDADVRSRIQSVSTGGATSPGAVDLTFSTFSSSTLEEKFRITSTGDVGIGTDSPLRQLSISNASNAEISFISGTSSNASILFGDGITGTDVYRGYIQYQHSIDAMLFATSVAEAMRIDSSGNLLVGTTSGFATISTTASESGHVFNASGGYAVARAGAPIYANRTGTDGDIAVFRKDGSTVGSIGVSGGRPFYGADNGSTGSSIQMDSLGTIPRTRTGGSSDGTFNLGASGSRWKDLYLSGGVVFGSTGGAVTGKTLDDYEEGTWTPSVDSGTNTVNEATYTKVGRLVTVSAVLSNFSDTTTASIITISGLPFTVSHQGFGICDGERFDVSLIVAQARTSDSKIALKNGIGSTDFTSVDYADINDGVDVALSFIVTYFTT